MRISENTKIEFNPELVLKMIESSNINDGGVLTYIFEHEDGAEDNGYSADMWVSELKYMKKGTYRSMTLQCFDVDSDGKKWYELMLEI